MSIGSVGVIGGGAWGTALALVASRAGRSALVFDLDQSTVTAINENRAIPAYLRDTTPEIGATGDIEEAARSDILIAAVPAQEFRSAMISLAPFVRADQPVVIAAKGIELSSGKRLSEVLAEIVPAAEPAVISGPSFAADVAKNLPTAVTLAASSEALALSLCRALSEPSFRPYAETDMIGVELGGALKNVLGIAAGIVAGRELGASAGAALVARGFTEMRRFASAFGAKPETLMGLSGLGDVMLTCSSSQSRNFSVGRAIGAGRPIPNLLAEGMATANVARRLADERGIAMPVLMAVASVLGGTLSVDEAIDTLMSRPLRAETDQALDGPARGR